MADVETEDLLELALEAARRAGADAADALLVEGVRMAVGWRLGALEDLERKEERELGLRVLLGGRQALAATAVLEPDAVRALAERLVATARQLPEDPYVGLPAADEVGASGADLDLVDPDEPAPEALLAAARAAEDAARAVPGITNSEGGSASWSRVAVRLAATNGFRGGYARTAHGLGATVLAGSGTAMERDYEWRQATHRADLPSPEEVGRKAGERAVRRLGARKAASATLPVVYDSRVASSLLRHLAAAISGTAIARGTSFLKDRLGERLFAPGTTVTDDPLRRRGLASRPFDGEGTAGERREIVQDGTLTTWLLDRATARQLGLKSTGHAARGTASPPSPAPSNLVLEPGRLTPEELLSDIAEGFYVTELLGRGVNPTTGDYSRGAAGFWIADGRLAHPVSEVTIAGNLLDMFARLVPANDLEIRGSVDAPTVRIDGMTLAGR